MRVVGVLYPFYIQSEEQVTSKSMYYSIRGPVFLY